jgi:hypothetical protein
VAKVAEVGEAQRRLPQRAQRPAQVERCRGRRERPGLPGRGHDRGRGDRAEAGRQDHPLPGQRGAQPDARERMRQRRAERQRADHHPDREAPIFTKPPGHDLHPGRVDSGEAEAQAQPHRHRHTDVSPAEHQRAVCERRHERARGEHPMGWQDVGDPADRDGERARDEPHLHGHG